MLHLGDASYALVQYHFHAPSEHTLDGRAADLEAHLVHRAADGAMAVIGVLFQVGAAPNPLLDKILLTASTTAGETVDAGEANPLTLLSLTSAPTGRSPSRCRFPDPRPSIPSMSTTAR